MKTRMHITFILLAISFIIIAFTGICMDFKILILPKTLSKPLHIIFRLFYDYTRYHSFN